MIKDLDSIPPAYRDFVNEVDSLGDICLKDAGSKGFGVDDDFTTIKYALMDSALLDDDVVHRIMQRLEAMHDAERLALVHSEVSEALESRRHGDPPDDKIPEFTGVEAELADSVIRILHHAAARNLRLGEAIVHKLLYNRTRPFKHGGKAF